VREPKVEIMRISTAKGQRDAGNESVGVAFPDFPAYRHLCTCVGISTDFFACGAAMATKLRTINSAK